MEERPVEERPVEERPVEEQITEEKVTEKKQRKELSRKQLIAIRLIGGFMTAGLLFGTMLLIFTAIAIMPHTIEPITYAVTYNFKWMAAFITLAAIGLIITFLAFIFIALKRCSKKIILLFTSIFLAVVLAGFSGWSYYCYDYLRTVVNLDIDWMPRVPKYTEMSINDFFDDVNRYPGRYEGKTVSLEGYVRECYDDTIIIRLGWQNHSDAELFVTYIWDDNHPRVVTGDYIVVTGTVDVFLSKKTGVYSAVIRDAVCEIKEKP